MIQSRIECGTLSTRAANGKTSDRDMWRLRTTNRGLIRREG
ncbi:hypothetical protein DSL72_006840 [Monilinia vaccinii-corymbosi]|uniref:Uncharacterized protein n=1 Tax=Monilinia vaccinii-corymbosi TaxID=61207 RepID=A0A8A3PK67_9HELO|nr:hypothetical protein DSL72_006840 [Monilinia vaccinii-corymbosi]